MTLYGVGRDIRYETLDGWAVFAEPDVIRDLVSERTALNAAEAARASVACFTPAERVKGVPGHRWDEHRLSGGPEDVGVADGRWFAVKLGKDASAWFKEFKDSYGGAAECLAEELSMLAWRDGHRVVCLPQIAWPSPVSPRRLDAALRGEPGYRRFKARWGDEAAQAAKRYPWPGRKVSVEPSTEVVVLVDGGHPLCAHAAELAEAGAVLAVCGGGGAKFRGGLSHIPALFDSDDHFSNRAYELVPQSGLVVAVGSAADGCAMNVKAACGGRFSVVAMKFEQDMPFPLLAMGSGNGVRLSMWTRDAEPFRSPFRGAMGKVALAYESRSERARSIAASLAKFRDVDVVKVPDVASADVFVGTEDGWLKSVLRVVDAMHSGAAACSSCRFPQWLPGGEMTGVVDVSGDVRGAVAKLIKLVDDEGEREELTRFSREAADAMHPGEVMSRILEFVG